MNKLKNINFNDNTQLWLDYTISIKFYEIFKENSKYTSYLSFCLNVFNNLKNKNNKGLYYITIVMVDFNKISGFRDDLSLEYIIDFLQNKRYEKFYEISKLNYDVKNNKNK